MGGEGQENFCDLLNVDEIRAAPKTGAILQARKFFIRTKKKWSEDIPKPMPRGRTGPASACCQQEIAPDFFLPPITIRLVHSNWPL